MRLLSFDINWKNGNGLEFYVTSLNLFTSNCDTRWCCIQEETRWEFKVHVYKQFVQKLEAVYLERWPLRCCVRSFSNSVCQWLWSQVRYFCQLNLNATFKSIYFCKMNTVVAKSRVYEVVECSCINEFRFVHLCVILLLI